MKRKDFLLRLDELLELPQGSLQGGEDLAAIPRWDSLALIGFIALVDQNFGVTVPAARILDCKKVSDLLGLVGDRLVD